ncbi:MAG: DinB family protein [Deltaproteobacteria bacterium]|nr:DinB family protein [Deltaproteobacteria bacterium]
MNTSLAAFVRQELQVARNHLMAMIESLTQDELWRVPPRPDATAISYHIGHIGMVEDMRISQVLKERMLGPELYRPLFGVANNGNPKIVFPGREELFAYLTQVRARTLTLLEALQLDTLTQVRARTLTLLEALQLDTLSPHKRRAEADLFREIINHEYSHTKYIRRLLGELGKSTDFPVPSPLVEVNHHAIAAPQYVLPRWPEGGD